MCETLCLSKFNLFFRLILFFINASELSRGSKRVERSKVEEDDNGGRMIMLVVEDGGWWITMSYRVD